MGKSHAAFLIYGFALDPRTEMQYTTLKQL